MTVQSGLPGIVIILFFRCMDALFNAVNCPRRSIKWPLVAHTVAMFLILAVAAVIYVDARLVSYIDNQKLTGGDGLPFPGGSGPLLYRDYIYSQANGVVLNILIFLNACLADGLLVRSAFNSVPQVSDTGYSTSYVGVMLFIP